MWCMRYAVGPTQSIRTASRLVHAAEGYRVAEERLAR